VPAVLLAQTEVTSRFVKDDLVRFGVAMDRALLEDLDRIAGGRGVTRSEILRDLVRAEVVRARIAKNVPAVASLTLVYDHHVRELTERLTELQHQLGGSVRSTLHVHLDADRCLEVIVLQGRSDELQAFAERTLAIRGVTHGGLEIVADVTPPSAGRRRHPHESPHEHEHGHRHPGNRKRLGGTRP
jgi:CopG family nickel-responsive transcriptional regulator